MTDTLPAGMDAWQQATAHRATFGDHTTRVGTMATDLARVLGLRGPALTAVRAAARLHDLGKLCIPESILYKPGPLTPDEWVIMRQHPQLALLLLAPITHAGLQPVLASVRHHHEHWDGTGYPDGLAGDAIPLAARIVALVDVWDALTSDRPYRAAWSDADAQAYLAAQAGRQFDPLLVALFLALHAPYRTATLPCCGSAATLPLVLHRMQAQHQGGRMLIMRPTGGYAALTFHAGQITAAAAMPGLTAAATVGPAALALARDWSPVRFWLLLQPSGTEIVPAVAEPAAAATMHADLVRRVRARLAGTERTEA